MNQFVEINNNKNNVYSYGQGVIKIVILSGSGVIFPSFEYMSLAKSLAETYHVIGIEKLGYGYSDIAKDNRNIDIVVDEYRCVLQKLKIKTPVVLAAHSMGFLEAIRWAQKYPCEISGILGIDPATPQCYRDFDVEEAISQLIDLSENEFLKKSSVDVLINQLKKENHISQTEIEKLKVLAYRNFANQNWISEAKNLRDAIKLIEQNNSYIQVPMFFFLSNGEGTKIKKEIWINHALKYLSNIDIAKYKFFDYPHNLYQFVYQDIAKESRKFLSEYI